MFYGAKIGPSGSVSNVNFSVYVKANPRKNSLDKCTDVVVALFKSEGHIENVFAFGKIFIDEGLIKTKIA